MVILVLYIAYGYATKDCQFLKVNRKTPLLFLFVTKWEEGLKHLSFAYHVHP